MCFGYCTKRGLSDLVQNSGRDTPGHIVLRLSSEEREVCLHLGGCSDAWSAQPSRTSGMCFMNSMGREWNTEYLVLEHNAEHGVKSLHSSAAHTSRVCPAVWAFFNWQDLECSTVWHSDHMLRSTPALRGARLSQKPQKPGRCQHPLYCPWSTRQPCQLACPPPIMLWSQKTIRLSH